MKKKKEELKCGSLPTADIVGAVGKINTCSTKKAWQYLYEGSCLFHSYLESIKIIVYAISQTNFIQINQLGTKSNKTVLQF